MPCAARFADLPSHAPTGAGLAPGPGCLTVGIEGLPAWRGLPPGLESVVEYASTRTAEFLMGPVMTPAEAEPGLAEIIRALDAAAREAARHQVPGAIPVSVAEAGSLLAAHTALSATWASASAAPGGVPAASAAFTREIRLAVTKSVSRFFLLFAAVSDMHLCPVSPHGPGFVTRGSKTVFIGNLPAARSGDVLWEACGGPSTIVSGCESVRIG